MKPCHDYDEDYVRHGQMWIFVLILVLFFGLIPANRDKLMKDQLERYHRKLATLHQQMNENRQELDWMRAQWAVEALWGKNDGR